MEHREDAGRLINIVSQQLKRTIFMWTKEDSGLTNMQNRVLHYILLRTMEESVCQKDIEKEFRIRKSTVTEILQLMEKNGFIRREYSQKDARVKEIFPTEKALLVRKEVIENIRTVEEKLRRDISEKDYEIFMKVLKKMSENLNCKEDIISERGRDNE